MVFGLEYTGGGSAFHIAEPIPDVNHISSTHRLGTDSTECVMFRPFISFSAT